MQLSVQKRLAASVLKCSPDHVWLDPDKSSEIKEAITKADIRGLIKKGIIKKKRIKGPSKARARRIAKQKTKGRRRGHGSRKGKKTARLPKKEVWINRVRIQRSFLKKLRDKKIITRRVYQQLYRKVKGGFFRSKRHIQFYIKDHNLAKK